MEHWAKQAVNKVQHCSTFLYFLKNKNLCEGFIEKIFILNRHLVLHSPKNLLVLIRNYKASFGRRQSLRTDIAKNIYNNNENQGTGH